VRFRDLGGAFSWRRYPDFMRRFTPAVRRCQVEPQVRMASFCATLWSRSGF
jgi:hypothetical protein